MTQESQSRLAIFLPSLAGGGAERAMVNLLGEIARRGVRIDLVLSTATGPYLDEVPAEVRVVDLGTSRVVTSLPSLVRYLRRARPEVMLTVLTHASLVGLVARGLARVGTRVVVAEHDTMSEVARETVRRRAHLLPFLVRRLYPRADEIIAVSSGVADDLAEFVGLPRSRVEVVYNPVVTPEVKAAAHSDVPHPWLGQGEPPVVLGIGRLQPRKKDFALLIRAFAKARGETGARLIILGEGPERSALEELVNNLGVESCVAIPGFVDNPYAYLARASLFVLSSQWEGLPTVLIEALYCGVPVVSTDCPSGPREILDGGRHGVLVPVGGEPEMVRAISAGLAGGIPPPAPESWHSYELAVVADRYLDVLLGGTEAGHGHG